MKQTCQLPTVLSITLLLLLMSGCATITRGTKDTLIIETEPPGAEVVLSNGMRGKTPASFKLPRKDSLIVNIQKEGFEPVEINVHSQIAGAGGAGMAGNVILGGLIGAAVDVGSGAMNDLRPNPVKVALVPVDTRNEVGTASVSAEKEVHDERLERLQALREKELITQEEFQQKRESILREI